MKPARNNNNFLFSHFIDKAMLIINAARPQSFEVMFQWFRFAYTTEGCSINLHNQSHYPDINFSIFIGPISEVGKRLGQKGDLSHD
jgi:hypothetical protein